jgi:hypothetical protein
MAVPLVNGKRKTVTVTTAFEMAISRSNCIGLWFRSRGLMRRSLTPV